MTVPTESARRLAELFAGHRFHGTHGLPDWDEVKSKWGIRSTAKMVERSANIDDWQAHLDGTRPLGVCPVRLEGEQTLCKWGCGDVDDYSTDVVALAARVQQMGYPLIPCRSKSGGLHLFLFLREWEDPVAVRSVISDMMASLGHAGPGNEIFPKQGRLVDENDRGSWIVMPYFGSDYDGRLTMQRGVKTSGSDMTVEEFLAAAEGARTTTADIRIKKSPQAPKATANGAAHIPQVLFGDGPPCLEHLAAAEADQRGGQNNMLFQMAVYYHKADPANWRARLERANAEYLHPPGSAEGLLSMIRSFEKKPDYRYKCREKPMVDFCNSRLCRGRAHGVGEGSEVPKISHILCRHGEEKQWIVQVSGIRLTLSTMEFQEFRRFRLRALDCQQPEGVNFAPMKEADWSALVSAAMSTVMDVVQEPDQPEDVRSGHGFYEMFEAYTSNRAQARTMAELGGTRGKPWQDAEGAWGAPGWWYVRMACFERAAGETDKVRYRWSRNYLRDRFEEMGGVCSTRRVGNRDYPVWGFPPDAVKQGLLAAPVREHAEEKI